MASIPIHDAVQERVGVQYGVVFFTAQSVNIFPMKTSDYSSSSNIYKYPAVQYLNQGGLSVRGSCEWMSGMEYLACFFRGFFQLEIVAGYVKPAQL